MVGTLDLQVIEKFKKFQKQTNQYADLNINDITFELISLNKIANFPAMTRISGGVDISIDEFNSLSIEEQDSYYALVSGTVENNQISGYIHTSRLSTNSLSNPNVISWTRINGQHFFIQERPVCTNDDSFIMDVHQSNFLLKYVQYATIQRMKSKSFDWGNKAGKNKVQKIEIPIPLKLNSTYTSLVLQKIIVEFLDYWNTNYTGRFREAITKQKTTLEKVKKALVPATLKYDKTIEYSFDEFIQNKKLNIKLEEIEFNEVSIFNNNDYFETETPTLGYAQKDLVYKEDGYDVYSGKIKPISKGIYLEKQLIQANDNNIKISFATDGDASAGTNFIIHNTPFYINATRMVLNFKENSFYKYFYLQLLKMKEKYKFNYSKKANMTNLPEIKIYLPFHSNIDSKELQILLVEFWDNILENIENQFSKFENITNLTDKIDEAFSIELLAKLNGEKMISQAVYNQIDSFVNKREGKSKLYEVKYYVDTETAKDKASFINFLAKNNEIIENKKHYKAIDLCYGSGNLTTHIFGDTSIEFSELYLNDLNVNDRNNNIGIGTKLNYDFLNSSNFTAQYDLIIFNPQIGGKDTYPEGVVEFEKIEPIIFNGSFEEYLDYIEIDHSLMNISINEDEKSILVHSEDITDTDMKKLFKDIKIFNYYDIFYKSKVSNTKGKPTKIVQFRKTLDKISHNHTIVIFYGEFNHYKALLADYTNVRLYLQNSTKQFFVLTKGHTEKKCYEKIEERFQENESCEIDRSTLEEDFNIGELIKELEQNKIENSVGSIFKSESHENTNKNEALFKEWWYTAKFPNADGKEFEQPTKNAYFNGIKRLEQEIDIPILSIQDVTDIESIVERLQRGDLKEYNQKNGYNASNGLKQYIDFLKGKSNTNDSFEIEKKNNDVSIQKNLSFNFSNVPAGNLEQFSKFKNILFKGVPGTGKSQTINNIINNEDKLDMKNVKENVLRINIHSASSNSDLMQGIAISTTNDNRHVLYKEKRGAILKHLFKAIYTPNQPFVLVLEEVQENSLNELIGDLIYLIEDTKRTNVVLNIENEEIEYSELFNKIKEKYQSEQKNLHYVELPSLVENVEQNIKMIVPNNFYIFCTSNYRDDKKVIEDNLLRRFDVIEVYPKTQKQLGKHIFKSEEISNFLESLNNTILEKFKEETHPDRYLIGHAIWLNIGNENNDINKKAFYKSLLKVMIEFKEIREIEFKDYVKPILEKVCKNEELSDTIKEYLKIIFDENKLQVKSYKEIVDLLQKEIYDSFLN